MTAPAGVTRAAVLAVGAATPVGPTALCTAASIRCGVARIGETPGAFHVTRDPVMTSRASFVPERGGGSGARMAALARRALDDLLASWPLAARVSGAVPVLLALPAHRPGFDAGDAARVVQAVRERTSLPVETVHGAHGTGLATLREGCVRARRDGAAGCCIVGAADSYVCPETLRWLEEAGLLHGGRNAFGFVPGEGAVFCVVAGPRIARRPAARGGMCEVLAVSVGTPAGDDAASSATALSEVVDDALVECRGISLDSSNDACASAMSRPACRPHIDVLVTDTNGDRARTDVYGLAAVRLGNTALPLERQLAPATSVGDVGVVSGLLAVALHACRALDVSTGVVLATAGSPASPWGAAALR